MKTKWLLRLEWYDHRGNEVLDRANNGTSWRPVLIMLIKYQLLGICYSVYTHFSTVWVTYLLPYLLQYAYLYVQMCHTQLLPHSLVMLLSCCIRPVSLCRNSCACLLLYSSGRRPTQAMARCHSCYLQTHWYATFHFISEMPFNSMSSSLDRFKHAFYFNDFYFSINFYDKNYGNRTIFVGVVTTV